MNILHLVCLNHRASKSVKSGNDANSEFVLFCWSLRAARKFKLVKIYLYDALSKCNALQDLSVLDTIWMGEFLSADY